MFPRRLDLLTGFVALSACAPPEKPTDDTDVVDTIDSDGTVESDTNEPSDSDGPTDSDVTDTEVDALFVDTTIRQLRYDGAADEGELVRVPGIVTGILADSAPYRGFTLQDETAVDYGGIVVVVESGPLPEPGVRVQVVGEYEQVGDGVAPLRTLATLQVGPSIADSSITEGATLGLPSPLSVPYSVNFFGTAEKFESMLVSISGKLEVDLAPGVDGTFDLSAPAGSSTKLLVGDWFGDPSDGLGLESGGTFTSIRAILAWNESDRWSAHPLEQAGLIGYQGPGAGETDTGAFPDSEPPPDTDTGGPDPLNVIDDATPALVHSNLYAPNITLLTVKNVVVTAVRDGVAATDSFTVQSLTGTANAGLWVSATDTAAQSITLPQVGDIVDVTGLYEEYNVVGGAAGPNTQSRIVVNRLVPGLEVTGWTVVSSGNPLPAPIDVNVATFQTATGMEVYESMLVRLVDTGPLEVFSIVGPKLGLVSTTTVQVDNWYYEMKNDFVVQPGKKVDSLTGIYFPRHPANPPMRLAPTQQADVVNFR